MKPFKHHNARSVKEATRLLAKYNGKAKANAGGTDLLGAMRDKSLPEYPQAVVNIKTISGLDYIKRDKKGLRIGSLTRLASIAGSPEVKEEYGLLAEAAHSVASPHIRNMATIGGNLAQDVRCWYYRYPAQIGGPITCLRKGGALCSAAAGDNRYHSLFGAAPLTERPCASHCPASADIPSYLSKVRRGDFKGAAEILLDRNPIPAITGRICPVFCESECNRREFDDSVAIQCIERGIGDYILERPSEFYAPPERESRRKVAIVGSGPAGLAAAFYLRRAGHKVTVYERLPEAGGMLFYSIPPYRLPKEVVRRQIEALRGMGIVFKTNVSVGEDISLTDLKSQVNAVFIAGGTWKSLKLDIPGEGAKGVVYALDYLKTINSGEKAPLSRRVIVIGGGSVAIDAARTARRTGTEEVHLVCLECRDLTSRDRMLALDNEITEAEEEGIIIHPSLGIREITTKDGKAMGVNTVACLSVREQDGTFSPRYDNTCVALSLEADNIIIAIGQGAEQTLTAGGLTYTPRGTISVNSTSGATGLKAVFAGGDMVAGPSTVIQAVTSGREAARSIMASFKGSAVTSDTEKERKGFVESPFEEIPRGRILELLPSERVKGINVEDIRGLTRAEVETEARRCFNCGCLAVGPSDVAVALVALNARIVTTKRTVEAAAFFDATATRSHLLDTDEIIKEVQIPKLPFGTRQTYEKFTLRKPIDFAIVTVASVLAIADGVCKDASIVLGAVAPEPLRAAAAENFLRGRAINEDVAAKAGDLALEDATPLNQNAYKVAIAKTLVKRTIMRSTSS
jgi:NADPH-dependent glutamate synthase beta subunit-like oxidoreductase